MNSLASAASPSNPSQIQASEYVTMPETSPKPGDLPRPARARWTWGLGVGALALAWFLAGLPSEPHFVDESAYISQSFYADLLARGAVNDPAWVDYPAFDLPPLPKYLMGAALWLGGYERPAMDAARRWYRNTASRAEPPGALALARVPSALLGAAGCVAVYGVGVLLRDVRTGLAAAGLLAVNPLYTAHARRAMSDVPAEAFVLLALWAGLWVWREALEGRTRAATGLAAIAAGLAAGLAVLCKFSGVLAPLVMMAWGALALALPGHARAAKVRLLLALVLAGETSLAVFGGLNPYLTARPPYPLRVPVAAVARLTLWERGRLLVSHRLTVSRGQQGLFAHNAVTTAGERARVTVVQGFGRFGPFGPAHDDSTRRYDRDQDRGAAAWLPWVVLGACWAAAHGDRQRRAGRAPTAWAVLLQAAVALLVVTAYLPMAWNRYFLSLQAGSALLAAGAAVAAADALRQTGRGV
jgi:4-amino-4-deoxy-L-arabinose transferase-like glycosyltransferase